MCIPELQRIKKTTQPISYATFWDQEPRQPHSKHYTTTEMTNVKPLSLECCYFCFCCNNGIKLSLLLNSKPSSVPILRSMYLLSSYMALSFVSTETQLLILLRLQFSHTLMWSSWPSKNSLRGKKMSLWFYPKSFINRGHFFQLLFKAVMRSHLGWRNILISVYVSNQLLPGTVYWFGI